jgi:single-strand selective monofunctional uracil DNA glycosylase
MDLIKIAKSLSQKLNRLEFNPPVSHVYNPLDYAKKPYEEYLTRFSKENIEVVLLGMNPGPWGMIQTGIPFGDVKMVRDWLKIKAQAQRPKNEHPKRKVEGFDCRRSEVSGTRLWGWAQSRYVTPGRFFKKFLVLNYCPLSFMEASGKNRTPDKLPAEERRQLLDACDLSLRQSIEFLKPKYVIGVGKFAQDRAEIALNGIKVIIGGILHPSPASPKANKDWAGQATKQFQELGIRI